MAKFNDIDMNRWKDASDIETDSLWIINKRDNSGKHNGFYHGNFVPQIPRQLIRRYTKKNDIIFDPFLGSGTTAFECQMLERNFIGIDIKKDMIDFVNSKLKETNLLDYQNKENFYFCIEGDSTNKDTFNPIKKFLSEQGKKSIQFAILHPPYYDILKFSDKREDLANANSLEEFLFRFSSVVRNTYEILENYRYLAIVIGDKYSAGEWVPLGFYCMNEAKKIGLKLKSIVVKNMEGNRAKLNSSDIWRYRALSSDYYIFKHEYIFVFQKG